MNRFVVDSSVVLSWLFEDEATEESEAILQSLVAGSSAEAPALLRHEVSNSLVIAYTKKKRISRDQCFARLRDFDALPIRYDNDAAMLATSIAAQLAVDQDLTVYDVALRRAGAPQRL